MSEIIVVDRSRELPKLELLAKYIGASETPFLTKEADQNILEQIRNKTPREIQKSARDTFAELTVRERGIVIGLNAMTLTVSFNAPCQDIMETSKADELDGLLWQPFVVKVFMGSQEVGKTYARILSLGSGIDPKKKKFAHSIIFQTSTKEAERKNRFKTFTWLPQGKPSDVFGDNIKQIAGQVGFVDTQGEKMLIKPVFFPEASFLTLAIMADTSRFLSTGEFNGRVYKRNPCLTETIQIAHHTYLGEGKSWPKDMVIHDDCGNFFFVEKLL